MFVSFESSLGFFIKEFTNTKPSSNKDKKVLDQAKNILVSNDNIIIMSEKKMKTEDFYAIGL